MDSKRNIIRTLYQLLYKHCQDLEVVFDILYVLQKPESDSFLEEIMEVCKTNQPFFLDFLKNVRSCDYFLALFYKNNNERDVNEFIISNLESDGLKLFLLNTQKSQGLEVFENELRFRKKTIEQSERLRISGDIFTQSQEILKEINYQHNFVFLWKRFVYLFQDQINHKNLAVWIKTFNYLKNQQEIELEEFLTSNPENPFSNLIQLKQNQLDVSNLLAFIYSFWPLILLCPQSFFAYTTKILAHYIKDLNDIETLKVIALVKGTDIEQLLVDPNLCVNFKKEFTYENSQFHQIFLNIKSEDKVRATHLLVQFIDDYCQRALPLVLKHKTPHSWHPYASALVFSQEMQLISTRLIEKTFTFKLLQHDFWGSFEEILNFQPFEILKDLDEELLSLFPSIISKHILQGKKTWGSSWFGFYVIIASNPETASFQIFLRHFKALPFHVQSYKLIYYMSSVTFPDYKHFFFVYQVLAFINVANHPNNVLEIIDDTHERKLILQVSKQSPQVDWINSSVVIHSLKKRPTLLEHMLNKTCNFTLSDLEYFDPYSPVVLWLFLKAGQSIEDTTIIHPQRDSLELYLNYWKKYPLSKTLSSS